MPYVKGRDGRARSINNPLEGSVGDINLDDITTTTLSASGNVTGSYILGNGSAISGLRTGQLSNDAGFITAATANVVSVNGQTGAVSLTIPTATSNLTNDSGYITTATANVISVNGQTGAVSLSIPTATSNLTNDSGYITTATANVISVNGQTGAVTISTGGNVTAANVAYDETTPADWPTAVANVQAALDVLANALANFESGVGFTFAGPFSNDSAANTGGVAIGQIYYNNSGLLVVRQT